MKRIYFIMLWLLLSFLFTSSVYAQSNYLLNAGENQTIILGENISLNGKILKGNRVNIVEYRWEELGKTLKDIDNDDILYRDYKEGERVYTPKSAGRHLLMFKVKDKKGNWYEDSMLVTVKSKSENIKLAVHASTRGQFQVGVNIRITGYVTYGDKNNIEYYHWEENGKILKNTKGKKILYYDDKNRFDNIKFKKGGKHTLLFVAHDFTGKVYKKELKLILEKVQVDAGRESTLEEGDVVKLEGKVANTKEKIIRFEWRLGIRHPDISGTRSVYSWEVIKDINGKKIIYYDNKDRVHYYKPPNRGTVYLKFVVITEDGSESSSQKKLIINRVTLLDKHGDSPETATRIVVNKKIHGVLNTEKDKDYFKFTLNKKQYVYTRLTMRCSNSHQSLFDNKQQLIKNQLFYEDHRLDFLQNSRINHHSSIKINQSTNKIYS